MRIFTQWLLSLTPSKHCQVNHIHTCNKHQNIIATKSIFDHAMAFWQCSRMRHLWILNSENERCINISLLCLNNLYFVISQNRVKTCTHKSRLESSKLDTRQALYRVSGRRVSNLVTWSGNQVQHKVYGGTNTYNSKHTTPYCLVLGIP